MLRPKPEVDSVASTLFQAESILLSGLWHRSHPAYAFREGPLRDDGNFAASVWRVHVDGFPALFAPFIQDCFDLLIFCSEDAADRLNSIFPLCGFFWHFNLS